MNYKYRNIRLFSDYDSNTFKKRIDFVIKSTQKNMTFNDVAFQQEINQAISMVNNKRKTLSRNSA